MRNEFFRINMPYGIRKNENGEWSAFNREYMPLGWNRTRHTGDDFSGLPIHTKYKGLTEAKLSKLAPEEDMLRYDEAGKINKVFFYKDDTCPENNPTHWNSYFAIIKSLSGTKKAMEHLVS